MAPSARAWIFSLVFVGSSASAGGLDDPMAPLAPDPSTVYRPVQRPIRLPVEISAQHGIFVQASLNGSRPLWFLLDSAGGSPLIVDQRRAVEMKLPVDGKGLGIGAGEELFQVTYSQGVSINVAGLQLNDQIVAATPLDNLRRYAPAAFGPVEQGHQPHPGWAGGRNASFCSTCPGAGAGPFRVSRFDRRAFARSPRADGQRGLRWDSRRRNAEALQSHLRPLATAHHSRARAPDGWVVLRRRSELRGNSKSALGCVCWARAAPAATMQASPWPP